MGQNSMIAFKCTTEEKEKIERNADKLGLTLRQYLLYVSLNTEVKLELKPRDINIGIKSNKSFL
jgi:hypothetical protein